MLNVVGFVLNSSTEGMFNFSMKYCFNEKSMEVENSMGGINGDLKVGEHDFGYLQRHKVNSLDGFQKASFLKVSHTYQQALDDCVHRQKETHQRLRVIKYWLSRARVGGNVLHALNSNSFM